jgi:acyl-CoA synthetase (NDP forming)
MPETGGISFVTQSGTFGLALVDWAASQQMGLHLVVGVGNKADVDDSDILEHLSSDRHTQKAGNRAQDREITGRK